MCKDREWASWPIIKTVTLFWEIFLEFSDEIFVRQAGAVQTIFDTCIYLLRLQILFWPNAMWEISSAM